jgi:tetratricopeptide (TPR) repeat protein
MMRIKIAISLVLFFPLFAFSQTVTLKSGKKIEGKIIEETGEYIKIDSGNGPVYYERKYIENIAEVSLPDANAYLRKGLAYGAEAKFNEALQEFKKGLELNPSDHNLEEAVKIIDDLNNGILKDEYVVDLFKGSNFLMNAQYEQAIAEFKEALRLKPDDPDINYYLGVSNYKLEDYEEAANYLKKALQIKPDEELYYYLGACQYSLGQYTDAIANLKKALEMNPDDADAFGVIGVSNYLLGRTQEAKENLYKARELFQNQGDYLKSKEIESFIVELDK